MSEFKVGDRVQWDGRVRRCWGRFRCYDDPCSIVFDEKTEQCVDVANDLLMLCDFDERAPQELTPMTEPPPKLKDDIFSADVICVGKKKLTPRESISAFDYDGGYWGVAAKRYIGWLPIPAYKLPEAK